MVPDHPKNLPGSRFRSYLVRHAEAGWRQAWNGQDELRPLTHEGRRQAAGLIGALAGAEVARILTSPFVRCVETVEPLAEARGLPAEAVPELAEGAGPTGAMSLLLSGPIVACSHGDVIEAVLDALSGAGVRLAGRMAGLETLKGAVWVLECSGRAVVSGRLLPPG
ncbi:MAG TPA: phosphoglycerate mutase family protein [Actinomycetota bacterium]|nr:phosphoglycerate mutase family protein [Actinomycetota bacterium]